MRSDPVPGQQLVEDLARVQLQAVREQVAGADRGVGRRREVRVGVAPPAAPLLGLAVEQAMPADATFLLEHALEQVAERGTGRALRWLLPARRVAGKTGTTNDLRDSWFAGFDGRHVATVWVGRDDNAPAGLSGSAGALRVWADMMQRIPAPARTPTTPAGIQWAYIDPATRQRVSQHCRDARRLPFVEGSAPPRALGCGATTGGDRP